MRRTYRSKKETASGLDRRDLFQNLDEKSSAYDAFSIQNIKQTKRELSCVGSSNPLGIASNRVRKKKYVKRIVKDPGTPCRDNTSPLEYLTPDKSIRVNKPLDPFDMLLMSSPACPAEFTEKKTESVTSNVNLFDQLLPKKEGRTYARRKPKVAKKCNYSSDMESSDSDKENSDDRWNSSDIRSHKLLVEHKIQTPSKKIDESINNIVKNLSLLHKLKSKYDTEDSFNKSVILNRHRLTRNIQSPLLQKSPLCSTPFKMKYRGESIFKFSPIAAANEDKSPKYKTITEHNDSSNCSLGLNRDKIESPKIVEEKCHTSSMELMPIDNIENEEGAEITLPEREAHVSDKLNIEKCNVMHQSNQSSDVAVNATTSLELSSFQTTESELFLGFSQNAIDDVVAQTENKVIRMSHFNDSLSNNKNTEKEAKEDESNENLNDTETDNNITQLEAAQNNYCSEKNCNNDSCIKEENNFKNDADLENDICQFNSEEHSHCSEENYINISTTSSTVSNENNDDNLSVQSENDEKGSLYDTCTSDQSSIQEEVASKEPVVVLQRLNDSLLNKYYDKMYSGNTESDERDDSVNSEFTSFKNSSNSTLSSEDVPEIDNSEINNVSQNEIDECANEFESNDEDKSSSNNEEEHCVSFVTTRRRNEAKNNSMISIFNDSYGSSSTDCDKTVLSVNTNEKAELKDKIDVDDTLTYYDANAKNSKSVDDTIDLNKDSEYSDGPAELNETRISFITDRKSSIRTRQSSLNPRNSIILTQSSKIPRKTVTQDPESSRMSCFDTKPGIVLQPGKKWERSLSIYRRMTVMADHFDESILEDICTETKGRKYRQSVISTMEMQDFNSSLHNDSINSRRSTFVSKPSRSTIRIVKDPNRSRLSLCNTTVFDDLTGFLNEECDDTIIELSKLSIADQTHEVTVLDTFHDTPNRIATPRDYVLRRCNQTDPILFDECYPDTVLKNCHKIGEGVYGEVFLWRDRDGRARVLKIVPIAGTIKVNGESQKDFHEIISEIVIAMELSALRAPIAEIERHFDEGKDVEALDLHAIENATDVFNEVLAVRCVYGSYPSRLLDLWDLYDECKGSENDNPAILPVDQQYIVLELANAGQDLESYQFNNAEQAHALFLQVAYGLAVAEEAFQFEHRDLHWGNVLIAPTEQKFATFVIRGRLHRVARMGVRATVIDYSLSRVSLRLVAGDEAALYNDLARDESLFDAVGDYQFQVYRLMRDKLGNDWKNFEPYTNILWLHYTVDKMITALRYKRINTKIHKHYIDKLKGIKSRILDYGSAAQFVLTDNEL